MGLCYWKRALLHACLLSIFAIEKSAAALAFTNPSLESLAAGAPFNLTWSGAFGTTTVTLVNQTSSNSDTVATVNTIASGIDETFLSWSPYAFTPSGSYMLFLEDTSGQTTLSSEFTILPAGTKSSSSTGLQFTNPNFEDITPDSPINVTWSGATGTTTLTLQNGTEKSINDVETLAPGLEGSFVVWTPSATVQPGEYVLQLKDDSSEEIVYSSVFRLLAPGETSPVVTAVDPNIPAAQSPEPEPLPKRPSPSHPNISPAAKIGVAVGSVLLTLLVIGIVIFYRRRHKDPVVRGSMSGSSDQFLFDGGKAPPPEMSMFEPRRPEPVELERGRRERRSQERWR